MLSYLEPSDVAQLAGWIRRGPPMGDAEISQMLGSPAAPAAAEHVARFKDHWRADRIAILGPDLPEPLREVASDLAARGASAPEHPDFSHWMTVEPVVESPMSAQELASMTVTDVTELVRAYRPPAHMVLRFPEYALVQQVTEEVAARPAEYPHHKDGAAPALDVSWDPVLNLAASIAEQPDPGGRNTEQQEDSPRCRGRRRPPRSRARTTALPSRTPGGESS
jgi:hypothetical protein